MRVFARTSIKAPKIKIPQVEGDFSNIDTKLFILSNPLEDSFPGELLDKMRSVGLRPWKLRFFVWKPNNRSAWHVDTSSEKGTLRSAINWVVKGKGEMQWNDKLSLDPGYTVRKGFDEGSIESTDNDHVSHSTFGHGCLVDTSIPHRVVVGPEGRSTVSLLWEESNALSFEETYDKLVLANLIEDQHGE